MEVSMHIMFQPIMYFLLSVRIFTVLEELLKKGLQFWYSEKNFCFRFSRWSDECYSKYWSYRCWQLSRDLPTIHLAKYFHTVKYKTSPDFQLRRFSVNAQFPQTFGQNAGISAELLRLWKTWSRGNSFIFGLFSGL